MPNVSYPFKKTNKAVYQRPTAAFSQESAHWQKLGSPVLIKEFGAIDYIDFSPVDPYYFAATCSVRVQIYDPITKVVVKNISKFVEAAYGGCFRADGRLLVTGSEESVIKVFDVHSKNVLRVFNGHTGPVHRTFFTKDQVKIVSFSDDKSVGVWDIATETKLTSFTEHTDYVRAGAPSTISPDIIVSGGYDHAVKLYDCRSNETVLTANHGSPVESVLFLPSGGIFISAGGTEIKVWDIFNGGKLLANISQHHKTVTTLRLASNGSKLMSASLDRHLKFYDIPTFKVIHNIDFPNAILSMAISENDDTLAVGMVDGVISIRKRVTPPKQRDEQKRVFKFAPDHIKTRVTKVDMVVNKQRAPKESTFDSFLRKRQYTDALISILDPITTKRNPDVTTAGLNELLRRKVLHVAIGGFKEYHTRRLLNYIKLYMGDTRFMRTVIDTANVFIDVNEQDLQNFPVSNLFLYKTVQNKVKKEIEVCKKISELEGAISMLLSAGQVGIDMDLIEINDNIEPSAKAKEKIVYDV